MTKQARRELVKSIAEKKHEKQMTYWVSRDCDATGRLSDHVDVWLICPQRVPYSGGVGAYYRLPGNPAPAPDSCVVSGAGLVPAHHGTWTLAQCLKECRVTPDDDLQVIRVGEECSPQLFPATVS